MAFLVRSATIDDLAEVIRLERQCALAAHWTIQQYESLFGGQCKRVAFIAQQDEAGKIAGFLVGHHLAPEWELENIVVSEVSRGKGIGTRLVQTFLTHAKRANGESVFLEVRESNHVARKLYEKLDFRETGRRKSYYSSPLEDAVLYSKDLRMSHLTA